MAIISHLLSGKLTLTVNGEISQNDSTANLVFKPAETPTEYSQIANFAPGDVLITGPSGCPGEGLRTAAGSQEMGAFHEGPAGTTGRASSTGRKHPPGTSHSILTTTPP